MTVRIVSLVCAGLAAVPASAASILLTEFTNGPQGYADIAAALEADGHTVDIVDATTGGAIAAALSGGSYTQLYLYDLTSSRFIDDADIAAIDDFFTQYPSIVQDSRSYGYYYQGDDPSEVALIQNIAEEFAERGGGLWIGTDHAPTWTQNANPVLEALGFNPIEGLFSDPVNSFDPDSVLLDGVTATDLWAANESVGQVSLGLQPNGIDMRFHFGHSSPYRGAIPYISASFGRFVAPDEERPDEPTEVIPVPAAGLLLGTAIAGLLGLRRRRHAA